MTYSIRFKVQVSWACIVLTLICIRGLRAQEPWPPSPLVPPDTTTYLVSNEYGGIDTVRRPPDSLIIPGELLIRFRHGALDSGELSLTYWQFFEGHHTKQKGSQPLSGGGPYDGLNQPRGFYPVLRSLLFSDQFWFDSTNNIVRDSTLKRFFVGNNCHYLHRLTTASPIDTLSVTRDGDTIGCDHADWMILNMDSTVNPLLLSGLLMAQFPHDIIEAYPSYGGDEDLGHVPGNSNWDCQIADTMINTPTAWDYEVGDSNILVAHFDKGIDYRHPGFLDTVVGKGHKFVFAWNYGADSNQTETYLTIDRDHGTACVGIIALETNRDSTTPSGIAGGWGTLASGTDTIERGRGVSMDLLTDNKFGNLGYIRAIFEASARSPTTPYGLGVHIINTSAAITSGDLTPVHSAVNYAYENGVVQVAANSEWSSGMESQRAWPAGYDPSWIVCVGSSLGDKTKMPGCDYGYSLDLLAPGGDPEYGTCGLPNLNWTARDTGTPPHYFYGGYGGTSIAAPNVTGSAALLLSTFYRRDTAHMMHIEPEDIERILEAAAWRGDADRDSLTTRDTWRKISGFGHLDIGNAYRMMDTTLSIDLSNYRLYHYNIWNMKAMTFGDWQPEADTPAWYFHVPTDYLANGIDSLGKYRERSYLLNYCGGRWSYLVKYRTVTGQMILPDSFQKTDAVPMFAWGRSGGPNAKSGWSLAQENFQSGFSSVINGTGGSAPPGPLPGGLEEGIFHNNDTIVVSTIQYQVWGFDTIDHQYDIDLGHCPRDTSLGLNFSVFARPKIVASVAEAANSNGNVFEILNQSGSKSIVARFLLTSPQPNLRIEIYDNLGRLVGAVPRVSGQPGWNESQLPVSSLSSGIYYCRLASEHLTQSKTFSIVR